jgi:diguanylate cyclase (GGDEF)-like protein
LAEIAKQKNLPVFALGVSEDKVSRLVDAAGMLTAVFLNHLECERLLHAMQVVDASEAAIDLGADLVVTKGERGAVVYRADESRVRLFPYDLHAVKNLMGVGDAFCAGVIDGKMRHDMTYEEASDHAGKLVRHIATLEACNAYSINALNSMVGTLFDDARMDRMTGLLLRKPFEKDYERFVNSSNMLLFIDCDNFKRVNDTIGHDAGDDTLRKVSTIIQESVRANDLACRWGGDEFVVLLPRVNQPEALTVAERIRSAALQRDLHGVTLSIGISPAGMGISLEDAIAQADNAMYQSKKKGRNAITVGDTRSVTRLQRRKA